MQKERWFFIFRTDRLTITNRVAPLSPMTRGLKEAQLKAMD
jgi:hypothetical protein